MIGLVPRVYSTHANAHANIATYRCRYHSYCASRSSGELLALSSVHRAIHPSIATTNIRSKNSDTQAKKISGKNPPAHFKYDVSANLLNALPVARSSVLIMLE